MSASDLTAFDQEYGIKSIVEMLGGPGVTQLFVHNVDALGDKAELVATFLDFEKYAERALVVARPHDMACVFNQVDPDYLQFLSRLGVGPQEQNVIVASEKGPPLAGSGLINSLIQNDAALFALQRLVRQGQKIVVNPYMISAEKFHLARVLRRILGTSVEIFGGDQRIVEYANHKHHIRAKAIELHIPVAEGEVIDIDRRAKDPYRLTPLRAAIDRHLGRTGRVIVKGTHGFSGSSLVIVDDDGEKVRSALSKIVEKTRNETYLVEAMLNVTVSPNILMSIEAGDGDISCVGMTDQLLRKDLAHEGNSYPSKAKTLAAMLMAARKMSRWLQTQGYAGLVGLDFGEYINHVTGQYEYFLVEVNPRTNASVYPKALMEHLNARQTQEGKPLIAAFLATNVAVQARSFSSLAQTLGPLLFNPSAGKGIIPYNTGCLENGKCSVAIFGGSEDDVTRIYRDCKAMLANEEASRTTEG